ncbi:MAG: ABC transporter ATP-binding protein [Phycisphaeraceae bacterium]|nr:ABC transporter ATP-binding protein [Phycisphaerales bacterium]MCB9858841.1 ABC transporter ATP-binding protein [Phycisphaeraceae bacterium]
MIVASHVSRTFGKTRAVDDVSFELPRGSSLALWGSNGAGKTTLIRCLLGVTRCSGAITIGGVDVRRHGRVARSRVGYVPQELAFHDDIRLAQAMMFFARLRRADLASASDSLRAVGLQGHERKRVRDLSGGMKQRLALATALLSDPPLIILDEPTSNLDSIGRGEVVDTLKQLLHSGKTLLFASHRPDEVMALAERVMVLEKGKVVRTSTPAELWPTKTSVQVMRLVLNMSSETKAAEILQSAGHAVHLNGSGLCVSVPSDNKATPIHVLSQHNIEVRDIELLENVTLPGEKT